jgi:hypothetical protein
MVDMDIVIMDMAADPATGAVVIMNLPDDREDE